MHARYFCRKLSGWLTIALVLVLLGTVIAAASDAAGDNGKGDYEYYVIGNPADAAPLHPPSTPGMALMGGGPNVDDAFKWMIEKSGGGNFVVIRASGTDAYNPYIYNFGGVDSVETLIIKTRTAASDPFVLAKIRHAAALFIAGGNQSNYVNLWKGTPVEDAINELVGRNVPIGGTSAGMAVFGQLLFSAQNGGLRSDIALADPYNRRVTLERNFLSLPRMDYTITDTHLDSRDRLGRLVTFLARIVQDGWSSTARGIGIDVGTAIVVGNAVATRLGSGSAYFLRTNGMPLECKEGAPLTYRNVSVQRMSGAGTFDLRNWVSHDAATTNYFLSAENGVLNSTQSDGSIY